MGQVAPANRFAATLRIVGRGPTLSRPLTIDEAEDAMAQILRGEAEPLQTGGFLLVLRTRGETGAELAGFVRAGRRHLAVDCGGLDVALDWPSYADRHRQQPWLVLAALLIARAGHRVLLHGVEGATEPGFASIRPALAALGLRPATSRDQVARDLDRGGLAYLGIEHLAPGIRELLDLRPWLGVRTAVNSFARALNPADAPAQIQGVFHPPYRILHRDAALLLGQRRAAIFKGGGGEAQRNPLKACAVTAIREGAAADQSWPALLPGVAHDWRADDLAPDQPARLWRGEIDHPPAVALITGTAALALDLLGAPEPQARAEALWQGRQRQLDQ
jgi:anthranilate phosphoribosyltransferase